MALNRALAAEDTNLSVSKIITTRNKDYKDLDLSFVKKTNTGDIFKKTDAAAVKQAVKTLLLTNRFEKPFLPDFGADLRALLFELADKEIDLEVKQKIQRAIGKYEPRVKLLDCLINAQPDRNSISVTVSFKVITTEETVTFTTVLSRLR